jgi:hypothetical protein
MKAVDVQKDDFGLVFQLGNRTEKHKNGRIRNLRSRGAWVLTV